MDEPALKAVFNVRLGRTAGYTSASNMPAAQTDVPIDGRPGYVWDVFQPTLPMSTYLVAFLVSDFAYRPGMDVGNGIQFRSVAFSFLMRCFSNFISFSESGAAMTSTTRPNMRPPSVPRSLITTRATSSFPFLCPSRTWLPFLI